MFNTINAISNDPTVSGSTANIANASIGGLLAMALNVTMGICWGFAFISMSWSGYLYVMSRGDPKATSVAFNSLLYGAIAAGLGFLLVAFRLIAPRLLGVTSSVATPAGF